MKPPQTIFARNLERLMNRKNWSGAQFVRHSGIDRSTLTRWKSGAVPKPEQVKKVAAVFGVSPDELMSESFGDELGARPHRRIGEAHASPGIEAVVTDAPTRRVSLVWQAEQTGAEILTRLVQMLDAEPDERRRLHRQICARADEHLAMLEGRDLSPLAFVAREL